ncbi:MAG: RecX family transcriptional regulator [Chloroflexi bacterium]|nr:RecX family transcriptional regulator [Chloroflexota bacterium]
MPTITELKETKRGRIAVFLDGRFWRSFAPDFLARLSVKKGTELSALDVAGLDDEGERRKVFDRALVFLGYRARSASEVETRLRRDGYDRSVIGSTIARLTELGYVDDVAFAKEWIETRSATRHYGKKRLQSELRRRGVPSEIIESRLEECCSQEDEEAKATEAARIWLNRSRGARKSNEWRAAPTVESNAEPTVAPPMEQNAAPNAERNAARPARVPGAPKTGNDDIRRLVAHLAGKGFASAVAFRVAKNVVQSATLPGCDDDEYFDR